MKMQNPWKSPPVQSLKDERKSCCEDFSSEPPAAELYESHCFEDHNVVATSYI